MKEYILFEIVHNTIWYRNLAEKDTVINQSRPNAALDKVEVAGLREKSNR